ncbi:codanin-1 [Anabrus simplex]|uniref:codanin-1 n=1 Tax=Anabrus simplex TaxID=316456 RepID=UPI0035A34E85
MAADILSQIISGKIQWTEFLAWVTAQNTSPSSDTAFANYNCNRGEFVLYFLNFLRDDAVSILRNSSSGASPLKKPVSSVQKKENDISNSAGKKNFNRRIELFPSRSGNQDTGNRSSCHSYPGSVENCSANISINDSKQTFSIDESCNSNRLSHSSVGNVSIVTKRKIPLMPSGGNCEGVFLQNCPLSPIANENYVAQPRGQVSFGDYALKDNRKSHSNKKRASLNRQQTSSPTNDGGDNVNKNHKRRIKPTRLTDNSGKLQDNNTALGFGFATRPLEPSTPFRQPSDSSNYADFRDLLRQEKLKQQSPRQMSQQPVIQNGGTPSKASTSRVLPSPTLVSLPQELTVLANVYCSLLEHNLISNLVSELCFVFSLLVVQEYSPSEQNEQIELSQENDVQYFKSVHECAYFATLVLNNQRHILSILDKVALKMLIDNVRIVNFVPDLWKYLCHIYGTKDIEKSRTIKPSPFRANVSFQSDTDNRENFPSDQAFHAFRKQRDAFYEILQTWEINHSLPGWSFSVALGSRVRSLLNLHNDPSNFIHFARLFRSQLLESCQGSTNLLEHAALDSDMQTILKCLKEGNPEKFSRLHERLVAPLKARGFSSSLTFPGQQEFYHDFIVQGSHTIFNQHLMDSLAHEILSYNASNFTASDVEDSATSVDEGTKQAFLTCVSSSQLLAKFFGFLVFLPYRTSSSPPDHIVGTQAAIRSKLLPQIDVLTCLRDALSLKKLTLTVPWCVQFLAMADNVSLRLPYYHRVLDLMFGIYRVLPASKSLSPLGRLLLELTLGWLFELPHFPEGLYYTWCLDQERSGGIGNLFLVETSAQPAVDCLDLVDARCLNVCCPFLDEVKLLLASNTSNTETVRHITPVPASFDVNKQSAPRQLELQLEESFLHGQPGSTRRTMEFVAERVASSCVKHLCNTELPRIKEEALSKVQELVKSGSSKELMSGKAQTEAVHCSSVLRTHCLGVVPVFCQQKCSIVLPALLSQDVAKAVSELCIELTSRWSQERVNNWVNSHFTPGLFIKDFQAEIEKSFRNIAKPDSTKTSHVVPSQGRNVEHNEDTTTPPQAIKAIRNQIWQVMAKDKVTAEQVSTVLSMVLDTACHRCDVIPSAERILAMLSVDLALSLATYQPELMTHQLMKEFVVLWQAPELVGHDPCDSLTHVVCPRNIVMLAQSPQPSTSWSCFAKILLYLLEHQLISVQQLEEQCVGLLQQNWSEDILKHLSVCCEEVVTVYRSRKKDSYDDFVLLMELLSELCIGMADFGSE